MEFSPTTHERARKINKFTVEAADMSTKTIGKMSQGVQNFTASVTGHKDRPHRGYDKDGRPLSTDEYKPGLLNRSLIAFTTITDGLATSGKALLTTSGAAATSMVSHRWGEQAGSLAGNLGGGVTNVGLVYIDVMGVSRKAVLKSVAKGMVIGKVRGGGQVIVGEGDGGDIPNDVRTEAEKMSGGLGASGSSTRTSSQQSLRAERDGHGSAAPPRYQESSFTGYYPEPK